MGESILYPMLETIGKVEGGEVAAEDLFIEVDSQEQAEEFIPHLRDIKIMASPAEKRQERRNIEKHM